jgi:transposase
VDVVNKPDHSCGCGAELHVIGEDASEQLKIIPAQFRVIVTCSPKYACRSCEGGIVRAPAPAQIIAGGIPAKATLAYGLSFKYPDHLPLYRQAQICSRQGINLDRSTRAAWVGKSAFELTLLTPVYEALMVDLMRSTKLFIDEITAPFLAPERKKDQNWILLRP